MLTKRPLLALAILTILCGGCSTNYYPIQGPEFTKAEVAPLRMLMGSTFGWWARPPRKFRIIGTSPTVGPVEQSRWQEGTLILLLKQRRTEVTGSCSRQNKPIFLAPTRPGMRRLSPAVTSPQPLTPAYPCRSFGEKGNISSPNM